MNDILKSLELIYNMLSLVLSLIKEFEIPGWGQDKKKAILNIVAIFYDKLVEQNTLTVTKEKLLDIAGNFIDIIVAFFNIVGWIKYDSPHRQFLGDSWLEKQTIPKWEKLFKTLGIYNVDYHEKFRKHIYAERYKTYINLVEGDIRKKIRLANRKLIGDIFGKKEFTITDIM